MLFIRLVAAAYWALLVFLLLAPDPLTLLGIKQSVPAAAARGPHFLMFTALALLTHAARWSWRPSTRAITLIGFALATETAQAFVPTRIVDPWDYFENLSGLAVGTAIWWAWSSWQSARSARPLS